MDDEWLTESEREACKVLSKIIRSNLADSRLITNEQKCQWELRQVMEWFVLVWSTFNRTICDTDKRIRSMLEGLNVVLQRKRLVSASELASLNCWENHFRGFRLWQRMANYD